MTFDTEWENHAAYLGVDAALAAVSWVEMSERDACSLLEDVDPEVLDRMPFPNLSGEWAGEWADGSTPVSVAREVGAPDGEESAVADAWEAGRDAVLSDALQGFALRLLGRVDEALRVERDCELTAAGFWDATRR